MAVLGAAVKGGQRPSVSCAVVDGTIEQPRLVEVFDIKANDANLVEQIEYLATSLSSKIGGLDIGAVVIRLADFPPKASRRPASDHRLMIDGALALVCRQHVKTVCLRSGKAVGERLGSSKSGAEAKASELDARRAEAVSAALSELAS